MNCTECEQLIDDYVYNRLSAENTDAFVKHVLGCDSCLEELRINYSVLMALDQMDRGAELSEDYDAELNEKLVKYIQRQGRRKKIYAGMCVLTLILSLLTGIVISALFIYPKTDADVKYGTELSEENTGDKILGFPFEGVPAFMDPVERNISRYNSELIDYIHSIDSDEKNFLKDLP